MHWADVMAGRLLERTNSPTTATGITPSGHIHVGNMREVLTAELVCRAASDQGGKPQFIYIGDTIDPLRKVYPFLDAAEYEQHIGKPLSDIPCPCGEHGNYAQHFLEPLFESFRKLGINADVKLTHELYASGKYGPGIERIISNKERVREILTTISGRQLPKFWHPYNPKCSECGKLGARVTGEDIPNILYECPRCGNKGSANIYKAEGKLPWRLDWPTRWEFLSVDYEPFGKDHATKGGSYDTGKAITEEIHGYNAPFYVVYEWIQLKGKGAMASSAGNVVSAEDMIKMTAPEVLRYLIARVNPERHIDFDPGMGILKLYEEYESIVSNYFGEKKDENDRLRMFEVSQTSAVMPEEINDVVPFKHVITVSQMASTLEKLKEIIERGGGEYTIEGARDHSLQEKWASATYWMERFAPDNVLFSLLPADAPVEVDEEKRKVLVGMLEAWEGTDWTAENVHNSIYQVRDNTGIPPKAIFLHLYQTFIGKDRGPRLGFFLFSIGKDKVMGRIKSVLEQ